MTTAVDWERNNANTLKIMAQAMANKDRNFADGILNWIAPTPEGVNVKQSDSSPSTLRGRLVEVVDPVSKRIDNPHGPAIVEGNGTRKWYRAGLLHNATGPAVIKLTGEVKYYYFGTRCKTAAELDERVASAERHFKNSKHCRNIAA